jgi:hypothetical protein
VRGNAAAELQNKVSDFSIARLSIDQAYRGKPLTNNFKIGRFATVSGDVELAARLAYWQQAHASPAGL